ncbi:beta strand repeat-containing protein [Actinokineospora cianjurensis]|uniref:Small secreted domain DUF320 n=1 Tax=Actinokineospora cianjurensis TaxID=585224 RepID=A0A421B7P6_9PSEU|nr:hypothetical protein [Actinokineospora cianjurensis]RLK60240.1 hypothetical protein CLV68_0741 [Actinokineospora cianjurensis]
MQTWAKRGFQTALVTGGLLMLGTGIASADDNINPDHTPQSALDAKIVVDGRVQNNSIGTVLGDKHLPEVNRTISTSPREVLAAVPGGSLVTPLAETATQRLATDQNAPLRGNKIVSGVAVPVDVSGNAIALGGDSSVTNDSTQETSISRPVTTTGEDRAIAGNIIGLDYTAPVQVTGNAVSVAGDAETENTATQSSTVDGDYTTNGADGAISGNVVGSHATTPVQLNGNAIAAGGNADAESTTTSDSLVGGVVYTDGTDSTLSGNGGLVPLAAPVRGTGTALGVLGQAESDSINSTTAQAGQESPDFAGNPVYVHTNGTDSTGGGNILQPAIASPVTSDCTSAVAVGQSDAVCSSDLVASAGGGNRSDGTDSVLGGAIGVVPASAATSVIGNAGGVIGDASTDQNNVIDTSTGGTAITRGNDSVLGGSLINAPVSAPIDSCANGGVVVGDSDIACENITTTSAGGDAGTAGDDSVGGGNSGQIPVTAPAELIANGVGALGDQDIYATETKFSSAGGDANTADDDAVLAANLVNAPVATPLQVFGNSAGAVANTTSDTALENQISAGGPSKSTGIGGTGSGNIAQAPISNPIQAFGAGVSALGNGKAQASNVTNSTTGDVATTDGSDGNLSGNLITAPIAGATQAFGDSVAVAGDNEAGATNDVTTSAGSSATTSGKDGNLSGNLIGAQAGPLVQAFGAAVAGVGGDNKANSSSVSATNAGGDLATNGDHGFLSGTLADVPAGAFVQPHGDAVSAVGSDAFGISDNNTSGQIGGTSDTSGRGGSLNGIHLTSPVRGSAPVYDVPVEVAADALTSATHTNTAVVGENTTDEDAPLRLPTAGGLGVTELPFGGVFGGLPTQRSASGNPLGSLLGGGLSTGSLTGGGLPTSSLTGGGLPTSSLTGGGLPTGNLTGGLPTGNLTGGGLTGGLPTDIAGTLVGGGLPTAGNLPLHVSPAGRSRSDVPGLGNLPTDNLTGAFSGSLFQAPSLHQLPVQTPALSGLDTTSALPVSSLTDTQSRLSNLFG